MEYDTAFFVHIVTFWLETYAINCTHMIWIIYIINQSFILKGIMPTLLFTSGRYTLLQCSVKHDHGYETVSLVIIVCSPISKAYKNGGLWKCTYLSAIFLFLCHQIRLLVQRSSNHYDTCVIRFRSCESRIFIIWLTFTVLLLSRFFCALYRNRNAEIIFFLHRKIMRTLQLVRLVISLIMSLSCVVGHIKCCVACDLNSILLPSVFRFVL